jgi:ATP-dependent Lhr-like helicase
MTGSSSPIELLNSRLVRFLGHRLKWNKLNTIQNNTIPALKEKNDTLVIAPTASGKTEAVLIPVFNDIIENNLAPVSVIYVSPLKALINDINGRIEYWCEYFNLTISKWHGDVSPSKKAAFIKNPTDFLLITPESLEVILMNKTYEEKRRIFQNVRYIIVDEIHYFVESDRGTQLNSLLNRISKYNDQKATMIGLSATVGNPEMVLKWLKRNQNAVIVKDPTKRPFQYKVICGTDRSIVEVMKKYVNKKILIFVHSRKDAERYYNVLKKTLKLKNIYVHHSSVDKETREESEEKFKYLEHGFMISTSTLELGIDIGNIDIVVQIRPPSNVSSFLQKIGRSGRRINNQRSIIFYTRYEEIFITLAEISLIYEGNIEDIKIPEKPKDIYFHQILSTIFEYDKIKKKDLYSFLKDSYAFSNISEEEFNSIIGDMYEKNFIDKRAGHISLGYNFEKKYGKKNFLDFYSVFCPNYEFQVKEGLKNIGMLDSFFVVQYLKKDSLFVLGGVKWKVKEIDYGHFTIKVGRSSSKKVDIPEWFTEGGVMDYLITRKIYEILLGNYDENILNYFDVFAQETTKKWLKTSEESGFEVGYIPIEIATDENKLYIYTFAGLKVNSLISSIFSIYYDIYLIKDSPYYSSFKYREPISYDDICNIMGDIEKIFDDPNFYTLLEEKTNKFVKNKFINLLPNDDKAKMKMELLYNQDALIQLVSENSFKSIKSSLFKEWG